MPTDDQELKPWERQRGEDGTLEPGLWFDRFHIYRNMGPGRTLLGAVNLAQAQAGKRRLTAIPGAWYRNSKKWNWLKRAEAWDEEERRRQDEELEADRLEWRKRRLQLLKGFFAKTADAVNELDTRDVGLGALTHAVRTAVQELRNEFDDLPTERFAGEVLHSGRVQTVVALPDNKRGDADYGG